MTTVRRRPGLGRRPQSWAAAGLALLLVGLFPGIAVAEDTVAFTIRDSRITESSGLATDEPNDRYWTVNDSGDRGVAYAVAADGDVLGSISIAADVVDVEAMALRNNRIFLADIGDNEANRDFVTVYAVSDPDPGDDQRSYNAYDFSYPDGPRDAEAFFLDDDGRMYIITKGATGEIYRAPVDPARDSVNELEKVGEAPALVTDAVFLPDRNQIAVRSYTDLEILDADSYDTVVRTAATRQQQGESITTALQGDNLLLGSEGEDSEVISVPIPEAESPSPSASPSATASTTPSPSAGAGDGDDGSDDAGPPADNSGTVIAVGLAAVVAVAAAAVVILVRRP